MSTTKLFHMEMVPKSKLSGMLCAWDGCRESFEGEAPPGWVSLLTFPGMGDVTHDSVSIKIDQLVRDAALCPGHSRCLDAVLKDIGQRVAAPHQGSA
jgi:hypothetical protein